MKKDIEIIDTLKKNYVIFVIWKMVVVFAFIAIFKLDWVRKYNIPQVVAYTISGLCASILIHEFVHYIVYRIFGYRNINLKFNQNKNKIILIEMFFGCDVPKIKYIIISLAPAIFISVIPTIILLVFNINSMFFFSLISTNFAGSYIDFINVYCSMRSSKIKIG